jgi:hypothetical protein
MKEHKFKDIRIDDIDLTNSVTELSESLSENSSIKDLHQVKTIFDI